MWLKFVELVIKFIPRDDRPTRPAKFCSVGVLEIKLNLKRAINLLHEVINDGIILPPKPGGLRGEFILIPLLQLLKMVLHHGMQEKISEAQNT